MSMAPRFMLDTDTVSYVLRGVGNAAATLTAHRPTEVCISSITLGELRFGAEKRRSTKLHGVIDAFVTGVAVLSFDAGAAAMFGRIRASLESRGAPIGSLDTLIAAHALAINATLVTNNTKHFKRVRALKITNWL